MTSRPHDFALELDAESHEPLFVRIATALMNEIRRGRLRPGDGLPGTRTLAQTLDVHRSTVVAAYAELTAQGWVATRPGGATFVADTSPDVTPRRFSRGAKSRVGVPTTTSFELGKERCALAQAPESKRGDVYLWGGSPDLRLVPTDLLARAYRRAAVREGRTLFGYGANPLGHVRLRAAIAALVSESRGLGAGIDSVMVTRGSQMALYLIARSLIQPGDVVAVESLHYPNAINVFRRAGAEVVPLPLDEQGLDVQALEGLVCQRQVRLVYITPHHQYPTTVTLSPARRVSLLEIARRERIAVIEDDYDQEFHYDGRPVMPLASSDSAGNVIYVGTLAKVLAPGLRLAFVVAPPALLERLAAERVLVERQGDAVLERSIAELFEDGAVQRHARRMKRIYQARRDAFCNAVDEYLATVVQYRKPGGGITLWASVAGDVDVAKWQANSARRGVHFQIGSQFTVDGAYCGAVRFGFAALNEDEARAALETLGRTLPRRFAKG